jgi:hypothetical protein
MRREVVGAVALERPAADFDLDGLDVVGVVQAGQPAGVEGRAFEVGPRGGVEHVQRGKDVVGGHGAVAVEDAAEVVE